jgi:hypothetical protein
MLTKRGQHDNERGREAGEQIEKLKRLLSVVRQSVEMSRQGFEKVGNIVPGGRAEKRSWNFLKSCSSWKLKLSWLFMAISIH